MVSYRHALCNLVISSVPALICRLFGTFVCDLQLIRFLAINYFGIISDG